MFCKTLNLRYQDDKSKKGPDGRDIGDLRLQDRANESWRVDA